MHVTDRTSRQAEPRGSGGGARFRLRRALAFLLAAACLAMGVGLLSQAISEREDREMTTFQLSGPATDISALLIESYGENNPSVPLERRGVLDVMAKSGITVDIEYMDTRNYPIGYAASDAWRSTMRARIEARGPYDIVLCADDDALRAVDEAYDELFPGTPVVFFSVNDVAYGRQVAAKGHATGVVEQGHVRQILEAATALEPEATNLVVIADDSALGQASLTQFEQARLELAGQYTERVILASSMSRDELGRALEGLGPDDVVFQLAAYSDEAGQGYTLDETTRFVTSHCPVPVFRESGAGVGSGITGASYVDYEGQGRRAAQIACEVVDGTDVADLPVETDEVTHTIFDVRAVDSFGLDRSLLPRDAYLVNDTGLWQAVSPFLPSVALLGAGAALASYFVYLGTRRMREDAAEIAESRDALDYQLRHDALTDLPNRMALMERGGSAAGDGFASLVTLDLDSFTDLNDSYGHRAGDMAIKEVAGRLARGLDGAFVARMSGDEFAAAFDHELSEDSEELEALGRLVGERIEADGLSLGLTASAGVANRAEGMSFEELVQYSDLAMKEAKNARGRNSVAFFDAEMKHRLEERIYITACLRRAIDSDGFYLLYQPQVAAATREVVGVEALLRLRDGEYGPGQFIPAAESAGLIVEIGRIVTRKAVEQIASWAREGRELVPVSINFSAAQLKDVHYLDFLSALLDEHGVEAGLIRIEITESLMLENATAGAALCERVHEMGMELALDDFGTGYSSLARMAQLPMDVVKLDKSLVDEFLVEGKEGFVDDVTHLVHTLGKAIVVEGVETQAQFDLCLRLGCDAIQGYYFSRPVEASALDLGA